MDHRTTDMAEAALLSMKGFDYAMALTSSPDHDGDKCEWQFPSGDGLPALVDEYQRGAARVEPKRFVRELTHVRGQMFSFLDGSS